MSAKQQCSAAGTPNRHSHHQGDQETRHGSEEEGVLCVSDVNNTAAL